jgi:uncharacterized protein YfaS (alpha-2-macroglobulin family)
LPAAAILARTATAAVLDERLPLQRRILTAQLPDMVASGLGRLKTLGDGRWGFWPRSRADLRLTAWVRFGCAELARRGLDTSAAGARPDALLDDATPALFSALLPKPQDADAAADARAIWADACRSDRSDDLDALLLLALADSLGQKPPTALLQAAWQQRESLDAGRLAVLALALQAAGRGDDAKTVMIFLNNLDASKAPAVATGWLGDPAVQAGALCLAALRIVPELPLADRAAMWLMALRRQGYWGSTHATAWACLALGEHATLRPSALGQVPWKLLADNREILSGTLTNDGETLAIPASALTAQKLTLIGKGLWYDLHLHGNADLPANSNGLRLSRNWSRIQRGDLGEEIVRPLTDGAVTVGDQIEVELVLESPLDLEQVLVEVPLSAGISPVFSESGPAGWWGRVELRADRTAFIIDCLPAGRSVIRYRAAVQMAGTVQAPAATALASP